MTMDTLIICEKPSAAKKIAESISDAKVETQKEQGVTFYKITWQSNLAYVVPSLGHLFVLKNSAPIVTYPFFTVNWYPVYMIDKKAASTKNFIEVISKLSKNVTTIIGATDYDIEGSVIGYNIIKYCAGDDALKRSKRAKFSSMTKNELIKSFSNLEDTLDYGQINAGLARHELDWIWGMNISKALSKSFSSVNKRYVALPAGRVQSPTLEILTKREEEIASFVSQKYYKIRLKFIYKNKEIYADYSTSKIWDKEKAQKIYSECLGHEFRVQKISTKTTVIEPPHPFDLSSLQSESYRCFGYSPLKTQRIAQNLYLSAFISYPRTSSHQFPKIDFREYISSLHSIDEKYKDLLNTLLANNLVIPREGKKSDPAHPCIHVLALDSDAYGSYLSLSGQNKKLYDLIMRRTLSSFSTQAKRETTNVSLVHSDHKFTLKGKKIIEDGWMTFYDKYAQRDEVLIPKFKEGDCVSTEVILEEKETKPPARYNLSSILKKMEEVNIGTKATRASIVEGLMKNRYIEGDQICVSDLGKGVIGVLSKHIEEIISPNLTAHFESKLDEIREGKKDKKEVIDEAKIKLIYYLARFKKQEKVVGEELSTAFEKTLSLEKKVGVCPCCGGDLKVIRSRKSGKIFVGCSNFATKTCNISYPLPQKFKFDILEESCETCQAPKIKFKRRNQITCVNPLCPAKKAENREETIAK